MKIQYIKKRFSQASTYIIGQANAIISEYAKQRFTLTLRQLYYQFVARGLIPNKVQEYKRLGSIINDARLAGEIDWYAIEDRTRNLAGLSHWDNPGEILDSAVNSYRIDKWKNQPYKVEVWVEKEALAGIVKKACQPLDVDYMSCRGYMSQSEMWRGSQRYDLENRPVVIIHLGDHDPSGLDMSRDIVDRLNIFGQSVEFRRIALNMDQVEKYSPPPNPAKVTDSRYGGYVAEFGTESWELDALDPGVLRDLIRDAVLYFRDEDRWAEAVERENADKQRLSIMRDSLLE